MRLANEIEIHAKGTALPAVPAPKPAGGGEGGEHIVTKYIKRVGRKKYLQYPGKVPVKKPKQAGIKKYLSDTNIEGGGVGSGCQGPNCGRKSGAGRDHLPKSSTMPAKPKKGWSKMSEEERRAEARKDPRQMALFGKEKEKLKGAAGTGSGWQYGYKPVGYIQQRTLSGFPNTRAPRFGPIGSTPGMKKPNASMGVGNHLSYRPNQSVKSKFNAKGKKIEGMGESGDAGAFGHAHIDPVVWFHPPSDKNPKRVPTDDPKETDDKFGDVTKRNSKDTQKMKYKMLKRSAPGGLPPQIPVRQTAVQPHSGVVMPTGAGMYGSTKKLISRPAKMDAAEDKRMRVSYDRRGCI